MHGRGFWLLACAAVWLVSVCGCTKGPEAGLDEAAVVPLVESYLRARNMALRVGKVRSITREDGRVVAEVSLTHADGAVGVYVRWRFHLEQDDAGWRVTRHES